MFDAVSGATRGCRSQEHAAKRGHGQFSKVAPGHSILATHFTIPHTCSLLFCLMIVLKSHALCA
jgi:hypothetical protein